MDNQSSATHHPLDEDAERSSINLHQESFKEHSSTNFSGSAGFVDSTGTANQNVTNVHNHPQQEKKLKQCLENRAREISGTASLPIDLDLSVKFENLQLQSGVQRSFKELDEGGHYNKRKDFEDIAMRPVQGNINMDEIFDLAMAEATIEARRKTSTEEARRKFVNCHGNRIGLIGQAGIGKSTLVKRMTQLILDRKVLPDTEYIFYIQFRDVDFSSETTLFRFMMTGCDWEHSEESDKMWIDKLKDNPNVVFVFDGLDEANTDQVSQKNPTKSKSASTIVRKILSGQNFPLSKKIITSRPRQFFELDPEYRPQFAIDVLGLNQESQDKLGQQICQDNFQKVQEFLHTHPDVSASCFVPVNCIIIHGVLAMSVKSDGEISIRSLTDVFVEALGHYIRSDHLHGNNEEVWKLAGLAWNGFINRKIVFTEDDFENIEINPETLQSFLCPATEKNIKFKILDGDRKFCFSHLIWQELFAAIYAVFVLPRKEFEKHLEEMSNPLWEVVSKFMFGLTHPAVMKKMKNYRAKIKESNSKKKMLFDLTVRLMREYAEKANMVFGNMQIGDDTRRLLFTTCSWVQEADDPVVTAKVVRGLPQQVFAMYSMLPMDVSCLLYVLRKAKKPFSMNAARVDFYQNSLQKLFKGFSTGQVKINVLNLTASSINHDAAADLEDVIPNTRELRLDSCEISSHAIMMIAHKIASLKQPIDVLKLRDNSIDDDAADGLAKAIPNIKRFMIPRCQLTQHAKNLICDAVSCLKEPMDELNLSANHICDEEASTLAKAILKIRILKLRECLLTSDAIIMISEHIARLEQPMDELDLRENLIDDNAADKLAEAIPKIKNLTLRECKLSSHAVIVISDKIACLDEPMNELNLSRNSIDDDAASHLGKAIPKIKMLNLGNSKLSSHAIVMISQHIASLEQQMDLLNLNYSSINDDAAANLAEAIPMIKTMHLESCQLSSHAADLIANKIASLKEPLEMISLADSLDNNEAIVSLTKAMHKIKNLHLNNNLLIILISRMILDQIQSFPPSDEQTIWDTITSTQPVYASGNNRKLTDKIIIEVLFLILKEILQSSDDELHQNYPVSELIKVLTLLANNDKHNTIIMKNNILSILLNMMNSNAEHQLVAVKALLPLALIDDNAKKIVTFENEEIMELLESFCESDCKALQAAANRVIVVINPTEQKPQSSKDGHIMISYQWDSQDVMLKVKDKLKERNLEVWMDVDKMEGSILDRMAEAVEDASVVLMGVSQKYRDSHNCRLEGKYTDKLKKPIIPIMLQDNYKGDGWLGLLVGDKLYYDLSDDEKFDQNFPDLLNVLLEKKY